MEKIFCTGRPSVILLYTHKMTVQHKVIKRC